MTMPRSETSRWKWLALSFLVVLALGTMEGRSKTNAQDIPKPKTDGALDDLLQELRKSPNEPNKKPDPPAEDLKKPAKEPAQKPAEPSSKPTKDAAKPKAALESKDKALDDLLEKLGTVENEPTPEEPKRQPPPSEDKDATNKEKTPGDQPDQTKPNVGEPSGRDRQLDEHLEELTGKRRKKNTREQEDGGAMSEVIKEMRDVEQRLGQTDTGEETRQKQKRIVQKLETLIEQMRSTQSQSKSKQRQVAMRKGQQPGQNPGQDPGANAAGAPRSKPERPTGKSVLAGNKDEWGHLPPELRQELLNVFKEEALPSREELVRLYYLAVSKKRLKRGE
jgi:hypothetical protein